MDQQKPQICIIHGGDVSESDEAFQQSLRELSLNYERLLYAPSWKSWLAEQLPNYDVLLPTMPSKVNAKYGDWALYFSKVVPFLRPDAMLIGHSLGGVFLAKYFTENPPTTHRFRKLILIAAPYDDESQGTLGAFKLTGVSALATMFDEIHILHSSGDPVVAFTEKDKYLHDLPDAHIHVLDGKQHFNEPTLPELVDIVSS